ncbi:uncharacterized protein YneF (UPF0154 family) [Saonia flava]|uniref:Uncharacterized protein YneF (UPF0154 family) n=2 Tax=Saonia flava TaxID=523696 RepID=A0A846QTP7_9FLAO|nr:uncharacterized protein YneF (UPF0154 family) [Saonia flava]
MITGISGVADGQGLAGSATILFYGIVIGFAALVASFFAGHYLAQKLIVKMNKVLLLVLAIAFGIFTYRFLTMEKQDSNNPVEPSPVTKTMDSDKE